MLRLLSPTQQHRTFEFNLRLLHATSRPIFCRLVHWQCCFRSLHETAPQGAQLFVILVRVLSLPPLRSRAVRKPLALRRYLSCEWSKRLVSPLPRRLWQLRCPHRQTHCPEPEPRLDAVRKRSLAFVRIIDSAGSPVQPLQPLSASTRDSNSRAAVIQGDVVHCYTVSMHARTSTNRDEPLLRVAELYLQSALHRVKSLLAKARARVSH